MISQKHRFHGQKAIARIYRQGQAIRGSQMSLKYLRNHRTSSFRAAVVVSRKVHKSAVVRNRIRRRLYETIRQISPQIVETYDFLVIVYSDDIASEDYTQLKEEMAAMLQKAGII